MIASLTGTIQRIEKNFIVLDVHGVGYRVFVSSLVLATVREGSAVTLSTHTHVREDALDLYGFLDQDALVLFEELLGVSGVGPKTALGVLSLASPKEVRHAIASGDPSVLTKVSGIGKKTAERIVVELKGKVGVVSGGPGNNVLEAIDALMHLGYSERDARAAVQAAKQKHKFDDIQSLIKTSLAGLNRK